MVTPLSELAASLGISILGDLITTPVKEIWKRLTKPEYAKYKNCFKAPFVSAFRGTLDIFHNKDATPYAISDNLYNKLSELDDIAIGIIFQDIEINDIPYDGNNLCLILTEKLKRYCEINGFNIEDIFYEYWKDIFTREYERCFKLFFAMDESFRQNVLVDAFSISVEKLNTLVQGQVDIKHDITAAKNEMLESNFSVLNKIEKLQSSFSAMQIIKEIDEDSELKKVQNLIKQYNYEECISYINLNINDNWKNKPNKFRAKMYNMLGNCYQNLNDYLNAKIAYKTSIEIDSEIEAPLYNLANIAMEEDGKDAYLECFSRFNNTSSELYFKLMFFKYLCFDNEFKLAEDYLETHLNNAEDYLFLKAMLFLNSSHGNDTQKVEHYLQEYINKYS